MTAMWHRFVLPALLLALHGLAQAHQPYASSTVARLQHDRLEVTVTMSAQMATLLAGEPGDVETAQELSAANFETHRPRLAERAKDFWQVFAGDMRLTPQRAVARLNAHGDAECVLIFPEPKTWPLRLRANYLGELPPGYAGSVEVHDAEEKTLGARMLARAGPEAELTVSAAPPAPAVEPVRFAKPAPAPRPAVGKPGALTLLGAAFIGVLLTLALGWKRRALLVLLALLPCAGQAQRQMEKLGRGVVAIKSSSTQVYVGWRLLGNDPDDLAFNLYRAANGGAAVKVNGAPLTATTDFTDTPGSLSTTAYTYSVRPVVGGAEVADTWANPLSGPFTLPANAPVRQYLPIPLQPTPDGALDVKFCWVGDLDGDGEYDFVVDRQPPTEARQFLEAYKRDGTLLWRMDMGPNSVNHYNIEPGSSAISIGHGDNVTVYDLDGDGLAEVIVRTANGVVFGNGVTLTAADNTTQFLSIINGLTGAEMARATIPNPIPADGPMNGHMGIFYPDGQRPSVLLAAKNRAADSSFHGAVTVWDWRGGVLSQRWSWLDSGAIHAPEGHQIRFGDVDNDGKDEFIDIGYVLDDNGTQLFNIPEVVHGDRFHMTDIDPDRPGLETFIIQQNNGSGLATAFYDSGTGNIIKKWYAGGVVDVGRGVVADVDASSKGCEFFSTQANTYDAKGNALYTAHPFPPEAIWWDADLGREFVGVPGSTGQSPVIDKFNISNPDTNSRLYTIYSEGVYQSYGGRPAFWGDLFGDWREEILLVANDNSELRIYTTKLASTTRLYTLMHNPQYRDQTTTKGYVQASYVDYYLGYGMTPPPPPPMVDAKLTWRGGAGATTWDAGVTSSWKNNTVNSTYADGDTVRFDIGADNTTNIALTGNLQPGAVTCYSPKNHTFDGTNGSLAGTMKLTKAGAGTLTVSGNHSFTGKTVVWDGALLVNGDLQGSPVTAWGGTWGGALSAGAKGGRIGGSGRFSQPVAVKYRGAITPGAGMGSAGTVTFGSGLTADDGATFALDLSDDPTGLVKANDRIAVTGNLVVSGKVAIVIKPLNAQLAPGTYTLLTYTGTLTGSLSNFTVTVPAGTPCTLAAGAGAVTLTVPITRAPAAVIWRGSGGAWDLAASQNWLRSGSPDVFVAGDTVTFDATGAAAPTATLSTALPTAGVTVSAATNYTFSGSGSLTGAGGLTKSGAGTLTISTTNDYTGPTTISGGVLAVAALGDAGTPGSIGASGASASNLVINGGTLRLTGPQTNTNRNLTLGAGGGTFDIATAGSSMQISGAVSGSGTLTKTGPGTLLLAATNTYAGGTVISGGTIYLAGSNANDNALGSGSVTLSNGTLTMADVQDNNTPDWNLIVPAGATGRLNADGRCSLHGTLTGGGDFTFYAGYIRTDLAGNWAAFTGQIFAITDADGGDFRITNTAGFPNAALDLGDQVYAYYNTSPPSGGQTIDIGALSGLATSSLKGGPTGGRTVTYRIGGKNSDSTFAGTLADGTGPTALTKLGTGALTLTGASTHTGATSVQSGALVVNGSLSGSAVTVQSGATLGGSGTIAGNVTVQTGGRLAFTVSGGVVSGLTITGNLTLNGTITITPVAGAGGFAQGTYTIATYSGTLGGTPTLVWSPPAGSAQIATFDTATPGLIKMTVSRNAATLVWTGAAGSAWDSATANWTLNGVGELFVPSDSALFDDTATATTVALASPLAPGAVTFSHSAKNYTLSGTDLQGAASLAKSGAGTLTISGANTFTGGTALNAGVIAIGGGSANGQSGLGTGKISFHGGRLNMNGNTGSSTPGYGALANPLEVLAGETGTIGMTQRGDLTGPLTGAGTLMLAVNYVRGNIGGDWSAFAGTISVISTDTGADSFRISHTAGYPAAAVSLGANVTAQFFGNAAATIPLGELSGIAGSGLIGLNNNNNAVGAFTLTWEVGARGTDATFAGTIANGTSPSLTALRKVGGGTWTLAGACTHTGPTTVVAGNLKITGSVTGTTSLTVSAGAALELSAGTLTVAGPITNNGTVRLYGATGLSSTGNFTNNGTLDLINSPPTLPAHFVNNGLVLDSSSLRTMSAAKTGSTFTVTVQTYTGHTYQLQRADSLTAPAWTNIGAGQTGDGTAHPLTDPAATGAQRFYRINVIP